jgi:hypothetical protein
MAEQRELSPIVIYQTEDGITKLEVRLEDETVWLSQKLMAELFQKDIRTINEHLRNIFEERELIPDSVIRNFRITAADGKAYTTQHYTLNDRAILTHAGKISHELALEHAEKNYDEFHQKQIVEQDKIESDFDKTVKMVETKVMEKVKTKKISRKKDGKDE